MNAQQQGKPSLLIVDDDPLITDTLNFVLSKDFNVHVADSRAQVKSLLVQLDARHNWRWSISACRLCRINQTRDFS